MPAPLEDMVWSNPMALLSHLIHSKSIDCARSRPLISPMLGDV